MTANLQMSMTEEEQKFFKEGLEAAAEEIKANLALVDPAKDSITPDKAIGRLTRMEAIQAQSMTAEGRRRQEARLRLVERALGRIEESRYGLCVRCGDEIPRGRLEVMPEAPLCMSCATSGR
jgi:DnaK suppressor protein